MWSDARRVAHPWATYIGPADTGGQPRLKPLLADVFLVVCTADIGLTHRFISLVLILGFL